ncbi:MAG: hypothetical protein V7K90_10665 [Nostoc sp.]|uniref:hypothetical protein n=1 Tax=Nostoc sp. TaxID=1180 RepID=UPI002FF90098
MQLALRDASCNNFRKVRNTLTQMGEITPPFILDSRNFESDFSPHLENLSPGRLPCTQKSEIAD